jgi:hypothetical protein
VVEERNAWLDAPFVLRHPFRVMQLLSILDAISTHLRPANAEQVGAAWSGAQSLRQLLAQCGASQWHVAEGTGGERLWVSAHNAAAAPATLVALKAGNFKPTDSSPAPLRPTAAAKRYHARTPPGMSAIMQRTDSRLGCRSTPPIACGVGRI